MLSTLRTLALSPIFVPQALWVASRATRLPEAAGPRTGRAGQGPALRVLIVGDSSAAGVGVAEQDAALAGRLAHHLAPMASVSWALVAKSGWTSRQVLQAIELLPPARADIAVLAVGVNDVKNGMHISKWRKNYTAILRSLQAKHGAQAIVASGVPPLGLFPLLPSPLRSVLGARAERFDASLAALCAEGEGVLHLPFDQPLTPSEMARDGFHPGAPIYDAWATKVAEALQPYLHRMVPEKSEV
ncbi:SGNH/GDSL hydrolase family protein [Tateyamaria omphalii]|uniref:SGNH/GDSL hydrolase family protein n=1 Tax=Tateyamaria omphalii TaxID=299262 RepID=UPI001C995825|nr:SGNH/GDSL hydrolase family protein [Tateyamaria omphalii]MBY5931886.1 SGNH/GDSL hydrolase family protein [Tateyamaria omphalii]